MGCCLSKRNQTADSLPALKNILTHVDTELKGLLKVLNEDNDIRKIEYITLIETVKSKLNILKIKIDAANFNQTEIRVLNKLLNLYYDIKDREFPKVLTNEFINTINKYLKDK
jgi:hypothetical protein